MKKVLVFMNSFNFGGITSLMKDIYRNIDKNEYSFSFIRPDWNRNDFDKEVIENGDEVFYYEDEGLSKIPFVNYIVRRRHMVDKVIKSVGNKTFDVAYIHSNAGYCVPAAFKMGIPNIIMHSHEAVSDFDDNEKKSKFMKIIWDNRVRMYNKFVTHKLGDSKGACIAKFGNSVVNDEKMMVVHPPINFEKFNPDNYDKSEAIKKYNIDTDSFNMIHVGRLSGVKNQPFLLEILKELLRERKANLYIVGEGNKEKEKLLGYAEKLGVTDNVHFMAGDTSADIYLGMDCSLLPSFSEAFGMVAVESQLMGVPAFVSDRVPEDVDAGMCTHIPLGDASEWARAILGYDYENATIDSEKKDEFNINRIIDKIKTIF